MHTSRQMNVVTRRTGASGWVMWAVLWLAAGATPGVAADRAEVWTTKAPLPAARERLAAGVIDGVVYTVGGFSNRDTVEAYTPATNAWNAKTPMPTGRESLGVGVVNGVLYAVGGWVGYAVDTVEAYDPVTNTWTTKAPLLTARSGLGVAVVNGILYAIGGWDGNQYVGTVEAYDPATNSWSTKTPMPTARTDLAVAVLNGSIYAVGGWNDSQDLATVEVYDPVTNAWSTKASMPTARFQFGIGVLYNVLYAVGGYWNGSEIHAYDPTSNTWGTTTPIPTRRANHAVAVVDGMLYAVGGWDQHALDSVEAFPGGGVWHTKTPMPTERDSVAVDVLNGTLYAVGGFNWDTGYLSAVETYDPGANAWNTKAPLPTPRRFLGVAAAGGFLYAVGGSEYSGAVSTVERYDPVSNAWSTRRPLSTARFDLGVGVVNGVIHVVGGRGGSGPVDAVDAYDAGTDTWAARAPLPSARWGMGVGVVGGLLYVVGGTAGAGALATLQAYDPVANSWSTKAPMPTARYSLAVAVIDGVLYAVGGTDGSSALTVSEAYDPVSNTWTTKAPMPTARQSLGAGVLNGVLYAVGGEAAGSFIRTVEAYTRRTPAPRVDSVVPPSGPPSGGSTVAIAGAHFSTSGTPTVLFGDAAATGVSVGGGGTSISAITPAHAAGSVDVAVVNPDGQRGTVTSGFTYVSQTRTLTVNSASPESGVAITVSPADNGSQGDGTTPFSRVYSHGAIVTLTAPAVVGANAFLAWRKNGTDVATTAATSVTMDAAYTMTAVYAPASTRVVRVVSTTALRGAAVAVGLEIAAQGDENGIGFTLMFDPAVLGYASPSPPASLGACASGATLNVNTQQAASGRLGIGLVLPSGQHLAAGACQMVTVPFTVAANAPLTSTPVAFGDTPIVREVVDEQANVLSATWTAGTVTPTSGYEADVAPRASGGNNAVTIADWVQVGRFAAGLDLVAAGIEYQKADCAPRATLGGGGPITIADWVQAGRYASVLDPVAPAGGPSATGAGTRPSLSPFTAGGNGGSTALVLPTMGGGWDRPVVVPVVIHAQGIENAAGFSIAFDPGKLTYVATTLGSRVAAATLNVNTADVGSGRVGVALASSAGQTMPAGHYPLVLLTFRSASGSGTASVNVTFGDVPVVREISDALANPLTVTYQDGVVQLGALPAFTDDPLAARSTPVGAVHIAELRQRIDSVRATYGLEPMPWTDATLVPNTTAVRGTHLAELRTAVAEVYAAAGLSAPVWTDPAITSRATTIRAIHITELRAAVLAFWGQAAI